MGHELNMSANIWISCHCGNSAREVVTCGQSPVWQTTQFYWVRITNCKQLNVLLRTPQLQRPMYLNYNRMVCYCGGP